VDPGSQVVAGVRHDPVGGDGQPAHGKHRLVCFVEAPSVRQGGSGIIPKDGDLQVPWLLAEPVDSGTKEPNRMPVCWYAVRQASQIA